MVVCQLRHFNILPRHLDLWLKRIIHTQPRTENAFLMHQRLLSMSLRGKKNSQKTKIFFQSYNFFQKIFYKFLQFFSVNLTALDEVEMQNALLGYQPISIAFEVVSDFMHYKNGTYSSTLCKNGSQAEFEIFTRISLKLAAKIESLAKNRNFWSKIEILGKNQKFRQNSKIYSKIENFLKNRNFGQKSKNSSKIEILRKNRKIGQKSKIWTKIKNLVKNRKFGQKSKISPKIENLVKNQNFGQDSIFLSKIEILVKNKNFLKNRNLAQKSKIWSKIEILVKNFDQK